MPSSTDPATRQQIVTLRRQGKTYKQIREATGCSDPIIAKYLSRAGLTRPRNPAAEAAHAPEGVADFQPPAHKETKEESSPKCGNCHAELTAIPGEGDECGQCGAVF